ncbi:MAG: hypothetical protein COV44_11560, partial [Deltaproteobacteria bacterium CG11_big_fil_rev_8_21_14_0_20_45_16]
MVWRFSLLTLISFISIAHAQDWDKKGSGRFFPDDHQFKHFGDCADRKFREKWPAFITRIVAFNISVKNISNFSKKTILKFRIRPKAIRITM